MYAVGPEPHDLSEVVGGALLTKPLDDRELDLPGGLEVLAHAPDAFVQHVLEGTPQKILRGCHAVDEQLGPDALGRAPRAADAGDRRMQHLDGREAAPERHADRRQALA